MLNLYIQLLILNLTCLIISLQTSADVNVNYASIVDGISRVSRYGTNFSFLPFPASPSVGVEFSRLLSREECRGFALRSERSPPKLHREIFHLQRLTDNAALQRDRGMDRLQEHSRHLRRTGNKYQTRYQTRTRFCVESINLQTMHLYTLKTPARLFLSSPHIPVSTMTSQFTFGLIRPNWKLTCLLMCCVTSSGDVDFYSRCL